MRAVRIVVRCAVIGAAVAVLASVAVGAGVAAIAAELDKADVF